jgi:hypothetical protein
MNLNSRYRLLSDTTLMLSAILQNMQGIPDGTTPRFY